jgi:tetratricopeptide (TPR) repeat protein
MQITIPIESLNQDYSFEGGVQEAVEYIKSIYGYPLLSHIELVQDKAITVTFFDTTLDKSKSKQKLEEAVEMVQSGKPRVALASFEEAVRLNPFNDLTRRNLGSCLLELQEWDLAKKIFESCLHINDKDEYSWIGLGNSFVKRPKADLSDITTGIFYFKKAIEKNPKSYLAVSNLAATYSQIGRNEEAISLFNQAIELNSQDQRPILGRAFANLEINLLAKAKADFQTCYELSSQSPQGQMAFQYLKELNKIIK